MSELTSRELKSSICGFARLFPNLDQRQKYVVVVGRFLSFAGTIVIDASVSSIVLIMIFLFRLGGFAPSASPHPKVS